MFAYVGRNQNLKDLKDRLRNGAICNGADWDGYRGTSLIRKRTPLGPYRRPMPKVLGGSQGGGRFLMGEVPL